MKITKQVEVLKDRGTNRLIMKGPTGTHSVNLVDSLADLDIRTRYGRALVHLIGFLKRNQVAVEDIARAVTHVAQDTVDAFGPHMTFCHAEFRRGILAAWNAGSRTRKGRDSYEAAGARVGRALVPYL